MQTEVFISGCTTCGMNAVLIARVKKHRPDATVYNTKYDGSSQQNRHIRFLQNAGISLDAYHSIVVENDGERITLLKEWKP